ncbi:MAG: glycosyltransferase family 4 protein [Polyangiaceae bacterium]|nr:glycosyltransferase family 4 protein [Polyangiaceae bacterium]
MRLLALATYPTGAACTRFRLTAYLPHLRAAGVDVDFVPFLTDEVFRGFYGARGKVDKALSIAAALARRVALLARAGRYDAVFVQREAMLVGPALVERALSEVIGLPLVFDFDDAIWMTDPAQQKVSSAPLAARLLKSPQKTLDIVRRARRVIAGSDHLAGWARRQHGDVVVLPTVVPRDAWRPLPGRLDGAWVDGHDVPVIGWVGTHSTATHLDLVLPALARLAREGRRFKVRLVGASRQLELPGVEVESVPWSLAREIEDFQRIDVGVAPLVDDAWSRGKCGFKQVQYFACGVPHVGSPVGGAGELTRHDDNGLIATTDDEWAAALGRLLDDRALRARLATAARRDVDERLSIEAQAPAFVRAVSDLGR